MCEDTGRMRFVIGNEEFDVHLFNLAANPALDFREGFAFHPSGLVALVADAREQIARGDLGADINDIGPYMAIAGAIPQNGHHSGKSMQDYFDRVAYGGNIYNVHTRSFAWKNDRRVVSIKRQTVH